MNFVASYRGLALLVAKVASALIGNPVPPVTGTGAEREHELPAIQLRRHFGDRFRSWLSSRLMRSRDEQRVHRQLLARRPTASHPAHRRCRRTRRRVCLDPRHHRRVVAGPLRPTFHAPSFSRRAQRPVRRKIASPEPILMPVFFSHASRSSTNTGVPGSRYGRFFSRGMSIRTPRVITPFLRNWMPSLVQPFSVLTSAVG